MKIDFTKTNGIYTLSDALNLPDNHTFTESEIELMKQQRFDNWIAVITAPPTEEVTTEEVPASEVE